MGKRPTKTKPSIRPLVNNQSESNDLDSWDPPAFDDDELDHHLHDEEARGKACAQKIAACFKEVSEQLGKEFSCELFAYYAKVMRPKKNKSSHDVAYDEALLKAYRSAPRGRKKTAMYDVAIKYKRKSPERQVRRLIARERQFAISIQNWADK